MKVIDVKRLHRVLIEELAAVQGSSTVAQRQLILREIQVCFIYMYSEFRMYVKDDSLFMCL